MVAYLLDPDGRSTMRSSVGEISDHPGLTRSGSGAPVSRLVAWLLVALLLGLSIVGCGGDQGDVDKVVPQASTAPGGSSGSESSPTSDQESGSEPGEASGQRAGSGPESSAASNKGAGSGSSGASGQRSGGAPGSPGADADRQPKGAPGAPGAAGAPTDPGDEQPAPGAPINIPAFTNWQGEPLEKLRAEIEGAIVSACGGTSCLDITVEQRDSNFHPSCSVGTDPPTGETGIKVERGTKFVIVAGSDPNNEFPCEGESSSDPSNPSPDDTSSSSDETQPTSSS
jgi:hypothetical protein